MSKKPSRTTFGLTAKSTIADVVASTAFDVLSGIEMQVFCKLLVAMASAKTNVVRMSNSKLHSGRDGRTAAAALKTMADKGVIKIIYGDVSVDRTIQLLA